MKKTIKLISAVLALILCLSLFAGCKSDEEEAPKETNFNYEVKPITDEPHTIDTVNDVITVAVTEFLHKEYPVSEGYYYCESHRIVASTFTEGADTFDVLAYRDSTYGFQPENGNFDSYEDPAMFCLISVESADGKYNTVSFEEFSTLDAALEAADGILGNAEDIKNSYDDNAECTPYRYSDSGTAYLLDYDRYITYCDNIIAEMINDTEIDESYKPIITRHKDLYNKLLDTYFAMDYVIGQFLNGESDSPKAYVLYRVLEDILEKSEEDINYKLEDEKKAQIYFEKALDYAKELRQKEGTLVSKTNFPTLCYLIYLYDESLSAEDILAEKYMYANPDKIVLHTDDGEKEFAMDTEEYANILRANQSCYISETDAFLLKSNITLDAAFHEYSAKTGIIVDRYIEYVYADGTTPNFIFANNSDLMIIPSADGKYSAYRTSGNSYLDTILDGLSD